MEYQWKRDRARKRERERERERERKRKGETIEKERDRGRWKVPRHLVKNDYHSSCNAVPRVVGHPLRDETAGN